MSTAKTLADYPLKSYDKLRYGDTDRQGHINNAVFSTFLETGRVELLYNEQVPILKPGHAFVIAKLLLEFRAEVTWPGDVWIGTRIASIGKSSLRMEQAVFQSEKLVAEAETTMVQMDERTRRSSPLSDEALARLQTYCKP